jgi:hypothetical protein
VSLLVTGVLGDEVEVLSSDDDGSVHLGGNDGAGQDTATDGDETGEGALLVCRVKMSAMRFNIESSGRPNCARHARMHLHSRESSWMRSTSEMLLQTKYFPHPTYRCRCPQWRPWGYGNPDRRPCTIVGHPCPVGCSWFGPSSSGRCEAASGKHAPTGRSTRSP